MIGEAALEGVLLLDMLGLQRSGVIQLGSLPATLPLLFSKGLYQSLSNWLGLLYSLIARSHSSMLKRSNRPIFTYGRMRLRIRFEMVLMSHR